MSRIHSLRAILGLAVLALCLSDLAGCERRPGQPPTPDMSPAIPPPLTPPASAVFQ